MDLHFDLEKAKMYKSQSQAIRVLTESWAEANLFCPRCGFHRIKHFPNNRAVADFYCPACRSEYELKSKNGKIGAKIADGAYETFIKRITCDHNPDFLILSYHLSDLCVDDLLIIPKHFFTPEIAEKRRPLGDNARRAGWVGCNILFGEIPEQGKISIIQNRCAVDSNEVVAQVQKSVVLQTSNIEARGWLMDLLNCVNQVHGDIFALDDIYRNEAMLQARHPQNNNIRPKIRQQLQVLRDKGVIEFLGRGLYRKIF
ncbi:MAG: restriction endonuclease [Lawsonibacter sp.]|jgi:type II restriction enzyme|nr:restriction endonuclease [Oscillospiraceae bacterium]MDE6898720.1 restriction endonuclease [Lawsonibacter sp.]